MKKATLRLILIISFTIGLLGVLITTLIWWTNLKPWYSHGKEYCKSLYNYVYATWVISLLIFIGFLFDVFLMATSGFNDFAMNLTYISTVVPFITGIMCYSYSSQSLSKYINDKPYDIKCYDGLLDSMSYIKAWAELNGKSSKFNKWFDKIDSKIIKYDSNGNIDHFTGYLCKDFGIPTLVFNIVQMLSLFFYFMAKRRTDLFEISQTEKENSELNENTDINQNNEQKIVE